MIRYLTVNDVYYSLNDVSKWLVRERILTNEQGRAFCYECRAYLATELANAYERKSVYQHLEPVVLPLNDYFVHWILWANLLMLLPENVGNHRKVNMMNLLLGNPDTVNSRFKIRNDLKLICMNDKLELSLN